MPSPKTGARSASVTNAYRQGMRNRSIIVSGEDRDQCNRIYDELCDELAPTNRQEQFLVKEMADAQWWLERIKAIQARLLEEDDINVVEIDRLHRWRSRMEASYYKATREFRTLRKPAAKPANKSAEDERSSEDENKEPPKPVLYWRDLETGEPVLAPGFTEDGPIDYRKPENRPPGYGT